MSIVWLTVCWQAFALASQVVESLNAKPQAMAARVDKRPRAIYRHPPPEASAEAVVKSAKPSTEIAKDTVDRGGESPQADPRESGPLQPAAAPRSPPRDTPPPADKTPPTKARHTAPEAEVNIVMAAIEQWRMAWQAQDTDTYLSRYVDDFKPSNGLSHQDWRQDRQRKIALPKTISLEIRDLRLNRLDDDRWRAVFEQTYRSDTYRDVVTKTLVFIKVEDQYLIEKEQSL